VEEANSRTSALPGKEKVPFVHMGSSDSRCCSHFGLWQATAGMGPMALMVGSGTWYTYIRLRRADATPSTCLGR